MEEDIIPKYIELDSQELPYHKFIHLALRTGSYHTSAALVKAINKRVKAVNGKVPYILEAPDKFWKILFI
jgi:hypothetical protein